MSPLLSSLCVLVLAAAPVGPETRIMQVAPVERDADELKRSPKCERAIVLIHGLRLGVVSKWTVIHAKFLDWQEADTRYQINPADHLSPDKLYDRAWAVTLLEKVILRLRKESEAEGKSKLFEQLKPFLMVGKTEIRYAEIACALDLTEGAVRVAVHRLRRRYRELLRDEIGQTLSDPAQVQEEMRALFSAFEV